ncbi:NADP-dependent oxidoreductase [Okibacterium endophyticum]
MTRGPHDDADGYRAVRYNRFGGPDVLEIVTLPVPTPGDGEVLLAVRAAGLNPIDSKLRSGVVPQPDPVFPYGIGQDVAGRVVSAAPGARYSDGTEIAVGDDVLGWVERGSVAERVIAPAATLTLKPRELPWEVAGSLMTAGLTARAAIDVLDIGPGDTVLVSAAAGGVGLLYSQLAIAREATVIGTAGPRNHDFLRKIGVIPVEYGPGLVERVRALASDGVTAVQDNFGRETIDAGLALGLPPERIVSIVDHAAVAELGLSTPGRYERSAVTLGAIAALVAAGTLILPIEASFSLSEVRAAFELLEGRHLRGKVVISI